MSVKTLKNHEVGAADGNIFAGYIFGEIIGCGSYSQVFEAKRVSTGESVAIKVALPEVDATSIAETGCFLSQALMQMTGSFGEASVEPRDLLISQYQSWINVRFDGWPAVHEIIQFDDVTAIVMDKVQGQSLRQIIRSGEVNIDHALSLVKTLVKMEACSSGLRHSDLKPENIMFNRDLSMAFLLDPGFFGMVSRTGQQPVNVSMTTPNYYPFLKADDMFAFGVILLELLSKRHPLALRESEQIDRAGLSVGESLRSQVSLARASFNYFPSGIYGLPVFLSEYKECFSSRTLAIALKCMSLEIIDKVRLEIGPSYSSFAELLADW